MFGSISAEHLRSIGATVLAACLSIFALSCSGHDVSDIRQGRVAAGSEARDSVSFAMNGRPVKLELLIRIDGPGATVEIDHPDGRTTDAIDVAGPGIRELCKEFPKEPGSWGIRVSAKDGSAAFWVALHDRKNYIGPDEAARRFVERE